MKRLNSFCKCCHVGLNSTSSHLWASTAAPRRLGRDDLPLQERRKWPLVFFPRPSCSKFTNLGCRPKALERPPPSRGRGEETGPPRRGCSLTGRFISNCQNRLLILSSPFHLIRPVMAVLQPGPLKLSHMSTSSFFPFLLPRHSFSRQVVSDLVPFVEFFLNSNTPVSGVPPAPELRPCGLWV